jgi:hypothetical protein
MLVSLAMGAFQPELASRHLQALDEIGRACVKNTRQPFSTRPSPIAADIWLHRVAQPDHGSEVVIVRLHQLTRSALIRWRAPGYHIAEGNRVPRLLNINLLILFNYSSNASLDCWIDCWIFLLSA